MNFKYLSDCQTKTFYKNYKDLVDDFESYLYKAYPYTKLIENGIEINVETKDENNAIWKRIVHDKSIFKVLASYFQSKGFYYIKKHFKKQFLYVFWYYFTDKEKEI